MAKEKLPSVLKRRMDEMSLRPWNTSPQWCFHGSW